MILPTIHLNGTSAKELCEQYSTAAFAVRDAINAVQNSSPHGRDYYPQGNCNCARAQHEHSQRLDALESIYRELEALWTHCCESAVAREARK